MSATGNPVLFLLLLNLLNHSTAARTLPPYTPSDLILLDCGSSSQVKSPDGRTWDGDVHSKFSASNSKTSSSAFASTKQDPSVTQVPYITARIFHSKFTYNFPVLPGPKFVRLYFYPSLDSDLDTSNSFFSLHANNYTLLSNFSASLTLLAMEPPAASFVKEFIITVGDSQMLNLTFSPSPRSFAFINGIEIVSMPSSLYAKGNDNPLPYVGTDNIFYLDNVTTALETVYRLNVGGRDISGVDDTGMYRTWRQDLHYIFGAATGDTPILPVVKIKYTNQTPVYTAPELVYSTFRSMGRYPQNNMKYNLTWIFPSVDSGFNYLLRFHFCEIRLEVKRASQVVFSIFINNQTAEAATDVILWAGGNSVPVYKDYVVWVPKGSQSKQDMWLALHPYEVLKPQYEDAILNGLEIFRLSQPDGNLAAPNPQPVLVDTTPEPQSRFPERSNRKRSSLPVMLVLGPVFGLIFVLSLLTLCFFLAKRKKKAKDFTKTKAKSYSTLSVARNPSLPVSNMFRQFSIFDMEVATTKFDDELIIGSGGFGKVYKGKIDDGSIPVAIKRLDALSRQGTKEFRTEIELLSKLRHDHLVSLIGYCDDAGEMILVYEYMHNGTLRDHLYNSKNPPLQWKQRLELCIGAAKGLNYLHRGENRLIIHRDVKSTNILIDENWVAKVSDFGLSRLGPTRMSQTHVSTVVKGSVGYVDPEYYRRQQLTEKSDVYSFGVVLFEVLCARPAVIPGLPREQVNLVDWASYCYQRGTLDHIIDPHLRDDIRPLCLRKFEEIADSCVRDHGRQRPTMSDVVCGLEIALQLQEITEENPMIANNRISEDQESPLLPEEEGITSNDDDDMFSGSVGHKSDSRSTISNGERSAEQLHPDRLRSESVFSEIINPKGR